MKKMTAGLNALTGEIIEREFTEDEYKQAEEDAKTATGYEFNFPNPLPSSE